MTIGTPNGSHPRPPSGPPRRPEIRRPAQPRPGRARPGAVTLARAVLTLGTVALALTVLHGDRGLLDQRPATAPGAVPVAGGGTLPVPVADLGGRPRQAPPVELSIPVIRLRARLARLGAAPDGTLRPPADPGVAGWYGDGPHPGDTNSPPALILGRADPTAGGVFARLRDLRPGNSVLVHRADGSTAAFEVYRLARYAGPGLPSGQVYAASRRAELRLVTSVTGGGPGLGGARAGGVVVYAALRTPEHGSPGPGNPPEGLGR